MKKEHRSLSTMGLLDQCSSYIQGFIKGNLVRGYGVGCLFLSWNRGKRLQRYISSDDISSESKSTNS